MFNEDSRYSARPSSLPPDFRKRLVTPHVTGEFVFQSVVPPTVAQQPDFLARAKAIWGEEPAGKPLSAIVTEAR